MLVEAPQSIRPKSKTSMIGRTTDNSQELSKRRQKKRETDRRSQQNKREKVKSRIAYLEGLVENLKSQDGSVQSLADQLSEVVNERDRLSGTLTDVHRLLSSLEIKRGHGFGSKSSDFDPGNVSAGNLSTGVENAAESSASVDNNSSLSIEAESSVQPTKQTNNPGNLRPAPLPNVATKLCSGGHASHAADTQQGPCECSVTTSVSQPGSGPSLWRYTDHVLSEHFRSQEMIVAPEDAMRQDIFVRALVHGWNAIGPTSSLPLSWRILRRIDEHYFSMCSHVERLAAMIAFYPLLQYHREPTLQRRSKVPQWLLKKYTFCTVI